MARCESPLNKLLGIPDEVLPHVEVKIVRNDKKEICPKCSKVQDFIVTENDVIRQCVQCMQADNRRS